MQAATKREMLIDEVLTSIDVLGEEEGALYALGNVRLDQLTDKRVQRILSFLSAEDIATIKITEERGVNVDELNRYALFALLLAMSIRAPIRNNHP